MIPRYRRYRAGRRWLVALGLLACVVFHSIVAVRFLLSPAQFRARTRILLEEQFKGKVAVGEAGFALPAGFRVCDLSVSRPDERGGGMLFRAAWRMCCWRSRRCV